MIAPHFLARFLRDAALYLGLAPLPLARAVAPAHRHPALLPSRRAPLGDRARG